MIPLIYVGYAVVTIVIALESIQAYQVGEAVWNAGEDLYEDTTENVGLAIGGIGLLMLGFLFMSRRN